MWSSSKGPTRLWDLLLHFSIISNFMFSLVSTSNEIWPVDRPDGMPNIVSLEVMCGKDHMDVHLSFSHPFEGIVSSKGQHSDPRCVYVPPSSGKTFFSFRISYSRCGTKPDLHGQFYENTVVVQYDKDLLEVWDEAKRLRCEWFNDYEKTASKPPMVIADLDVIQLDFRGDNVDCWMEIQHGKGPWAPPVSGIVPLGSTLTLVVAINDFRGEFDMRVKSCSASDGTGHVIKLSDEYGCVLRPKMISRFLKARAPDERASVITYAFFHAFKFPDALSVHIKCKVEICRHGCLEHCQQSGTPGQKKVDGHDVLLERKDTVPPVHEDENEANDLLMNESLEDDDIESEADIFYDDIIHRGNANVGIGFGQLKQQKPQKKPEQLALRPPQNSDVEDLESLFRHEAASSMAESIKSGHLKKDERFPHGPRKFEAENRLGAPAVAGPRALDLEKEATVKEELRPVYTPEISSSGENKTRKPRSIVVTDRKARSADVGVSGIYEVISEADLAFSPDTKQEAVTVFQGKIQEEVVYGICMPVPGFSVLFIIVIAATIVAALVAGSLLYRYQLQKEAMAQQNLTGASPNMMAANTIASWMTLRLFKMRQNGCHPVGAQIQETAQ